MADVDAPPGVDPAPTAANTSIEGEAASNGSNGGEKAAEEPLNPYADEYDLDAENPLAGSDDEEDGIQVTIGKIEPINVQFSLKHNTHERHQVSKLDVDAVPRINDQPIYDIDLASMEERPWRKPGADITDYFNYGFNEETWNTYCERQKKLRSEFTSQAAVNKALFSNIYLANPLGMPPVNRGIMNMSDGPSTVKVLTDNGGRFKPHHHGGMNEPVMRTVISMPSNVSGPPGMGISTTGQPPLDFSKPPPGMSMPPPSVPSVIGAPVSLDGLKTEGPPGIAAGPPGVDGPPGIEMMPGATAIPTVGSGPALDMSMPPPGFNPALPPPGMSVRPPPIGLPPMNIGAAGFNTMLPPPGFNPVRYPMTTGDMFYSGPMGRPPPLMGREFDVRRESGDGDDDRGRYRRRSRSRSPRRSDRDRGRRDDERRDRRDERKERDRDRSERSSRRHRSRSRDDREKRRDRDDSDRKRRRAGRDDDDDDRRERRSHRSRSRDREDRRKRDEGRSPDDNSQEKSPSAAEDPQD